MAGKPPGSSAPGSTPFFEFGKDQTEAMAGLQKELLEAYEQTSNAWLARVKSEVDLWSELAKKLTATRSPTEAMEAYQKCVAQRMKMAVKTDSGCLKTVKKSCKR